MLVRGQNNAVSVTVDATPTSICIGDTAHLHADAVFSRVVDFETGDFTQADFNLNLTRPWTITTTNPYEGSYCMKSNCEGINNSSSSIALTVDVPYDATMSFYVRTSSESGYDELHFYIDNVEQGQPMSGYMYDNTCEEFNVSQGTHTYEWTYTKDGSVSNYEDCVYVDYIVLYKPMTTGGVLYTFENGTMQGWTTIDADGHGNPWSVYENSYYAHNSGCCVGARYTWGEEYSHQDYLVSPQVSFGSGKFTFYAKRNSSYYADTFRVYLSTSGNTNASFFTIELTNGDVLPNTNYTKYEYDLSSFQGQGYVAIVYTAAPDQFYLFVDDIRFEEEAPIPIENDFIYLWNNGMTGQDIDVSPTTTATYTVTVSAEELSGSGQQTIVVYSNPNLTINTDSGGGDICEGDTITLYATMDNQHYYVSGDILCTDGSIVKPSNWPCGKIAKAIVFYVDATGQHGFAVDIQQIEPSMTWSSSNSSVSTLPMYSHWIEAIMDMDGYYDTREIRDYGNSSQYPAAWAVNLDDNWYLPSIGQLNILYGEYSSVNSSLNLVDGGIPLSNQWFWSSTQSSETKAMVFSFNNGYVKGDPKNTPHKVRQIIDF